ncbi:hypothetical protein N7478_009186 [Penicillium angulare]|uniref:uncharacterized protein n=1 Tax=Penicillium angulare TaxID=116970 RepID=UPI00254101AE|nr:uncharacterized protein N7478_009186 [Penicillium angulare]KAJ5274061.1 hypothetical protein N7478_009186 [Penicillium angulare]
MLLASVDEGSIESQAHCIARACIQMLSTNKHLESLKDPKLISMTSQIRENISKLVALLFDTPELQITGVPELKDSARSGRSSILSNNRVKWVNLALVIISFVRVKDLSKCENLPLSLDSFWDLNENFEVHVSGNQLQGPPPETLASFDIIARLILGSHYVQDDVGSSALLSGWEWSIFLDSSFDAVDPGHVRPGLLHIQMDVPARIVDSESQLSATLIGYHGRDVFSVVQVYEWNITGTRSKKWRLGFRRKQKMYSKFTIMEQCPCENVLRDEDRYQVG